MQRCLSQRRPLPLSVAAAAAAAASTPGLHRGEVDALLLQRDRVPQVRILRVRRVVDGQRLMSETINEAILIWLKIGSIEEIPSDVPDQNAGT